MGRKKLPLQYIPNNSSRRDIFEKRSRGLKKKVGEVATLCKAKTDIIVYGEGESVPQVYSSHDEAVTLLNRFTSLSKYEKLNNKIDQESFLQKRISKLQSEAIKYDRDSEERDIRLLVHRTMLEGHGGLSTQELTNVSCKVDELLKSISDRIARIRSQASVYQPSQAHEPTPYITGAMETNGALLQGHAPPQHDEWLAPMRSRGGDLASDDFNSGATTRSTETR